MACTACVCVCVCACARMNIMTELTRLMIVSVVYAVDIQQVEIYVGRHTVLHSKRVDFDHGVLSVVYHHCYWMENYCTWYTARIID